MIDVKQDVKKTKKKFYQDVRYKDFSVVNKKFIAFCETSGERTCNCKNAQPIQYINTLDDGTTITNVECSVCHGHVL